MMRNYGSAWRSGDAGSIGARLPAHASACTAAIAAHPTRDLRGNHAPQGSRRDHHQSGECAAVCELHSGRDDARDPAWIAARGGSRRIACSGRKGFQIATEKYSPQVGLDKDDYITNYIAGMPFPLIDTNDPKAAVKIAYNWHFGPVLPDDFSLAPWSVNGYLADAHDPTEIHASNDLGQCMRTVRFPALCASHRSRTASDDGIERARRRMESALQPMDDASAWAATWRGRGNLDSLFEPAQQRRFLRLRRAFAAAATDGHPDGVSRTRSAADVISRTGHTRCRKPRSTDYRLLGTAPILACVAAKDEPAGIAAGESGYTLTQEPFELRRAYILEMSPLQKNLEERTLIFIDSEIYVWLAAEFYESGRARRDCDSAMANASFAGGRESFRPRGELLFPRRSSGLFRSVVPAHSSFTQKINTGGISESDFNPNILAR